MEEEIITPNPKQNGCYVCKESFNDYFEHIGSEYHKYCVNLQKEYLEQIDSLISTMDE